MTTINFTSKFFTLAFIFFLFPPRVVVDGGEPQQLRWGSSSLQVPAGQHHLEIYVPYFWFLRVGKAQFDVTAQEGQSLSVSYRAPTWFVFARGKVAVA
jgi:hypothetical protein